MAGGSRSAGVASPNPVVAFYFLRLDTVRRTALRISSLVLSYLQIVTVLPFLRKISGAKASPLRAGIQRRLRSLSLRGKGLGAFRPFISPSDAARPRSCRDNRTVSDSPSKVRRYPRRDRMDTDVKHPSTSEYKRDESSRPRSDRSTGRLARPAPRRCVNLKHSNSARPFLWESSPFRAGRMSSPPCFDSRFAVSPHARN